MLVVLTTTSGIGSSSSHTPAFQTGIGSWMSECNSRLCVYKAGSEGNILYRHYNDGYGSHRYHYRRPEAFGMEMWGDFHQASLTISCR